MNQQFESKLLIYIFFLAAVQGQGKTEEATGVQPAGNSWSWQEPALGTNICFDIQFYSDGSDEETQNPLSLLPSDGKSTISFSLGKSLRGTKASRQN